MHKPQPYRSSGSRTPCIRQDGIFYSHQNVRANTASASFDPNTALEPQTRPGSPIAASVGEGREDLWDVTITIPLRRALQQLCENPSSQLPRCLLNSPPLSPLSISPTPQSCALSISPRSPRPSEPDSSPLTQVSTASYELWSVKMEISIQLPSPPSRIRLIRQWY